MLFFTAEPDDKNDGRQMNPDLNSAPPDAQTVLPEANSSQFGKLFIYKC